MKQEQRQASTSMDNSWPAIWHKWAPAVLTAPLMLIAYLATALAFPAARSSALGFVLLLGGVSFVAGLLAALASRAIGLYRLPRNGQPRHDPERQGISSTQLALLAAAWLLPRLGINHSVWSYLAAFVVVGLAGLLAFTVGSGSATGPAVVAAPAAARTTPAVVRVAPRWAQRAASGCLLLGTLSLFRLLTDGTPHFLWGGLILLAVGALLPSLVVVLGGGRHPPH